MRRTATVVCVALLNLVMAIAFAQAPAAPTQRIRGDVIALDGQALKVRSRTGEVVDVKLADNYTVTAVARVGMDRIVPGVFVGTASLPQADGTQKSLEVLVFPEARRGSGEGHYPWDLQPGSMMTNATVAEITKVDQGQRLTLKYKDGEKVIVVPPGTPVVTFEPGDRSMLVPGAHVMFGAAKQPDGTFTAAGVNVGKDGLVPPM
ncbi:MAG TPA: hypothetical protein VGH59_07175 [Casimicrobiaceae bacterium]|jgi:hypothetical protein